ncbi:hypothetical protein VOLCADRAFT_106124 [Volvox carteri f. nagariensis]|uniref:Uncharacterized protein n=1 Tax=Volvox carteri f. nagariensis TaxID=3068 RepID=D8U588_VOLCA|nr:uncharacterized protein VOLCADRAFT_106124 [Volvox carteri f. nagariensis]EFJ45169.1 hypothetical protein VOLCADRAFT_106124 [Volvox carteri f. nagariensis]|eukprot:XP_002953845.1 hypothetical protein VOLCADRAFT_106124 [Volvox carteri f. nagariensis]
MQDFEDAAIVKANYLTPISAREMSICAAINPCTGLYQLGFGGAWGQRLSISQDPNLDLYLTLHRLSVSSNSRLLTINLKRLWNPTANPTAGGTLTDVQFNGKMMVEGSGVESSVSFNLQARRTNKFVAKFNMYNDLADKVQLAWNPLKIVSNSGGGDISMATVITGSPNVELDSSRLTFEASSITMHGLWTTYANGNYVLQLSITEPISTSEAISYTGLDDQYRLLNEYVPAIGYREWPTTVSWYVAPGIYGVRVDIYTSSADYWWQVGGELFSIICTEKHHKEVSEPVALAGHRGLRSINKDFIARKK